MKKEFESSMVNEPSVFEPLRLYCIHFYIQQYPKDVYPDIEGPDQTTRIHDYE